MVKIIGQSGIELDVDQTIAEGLVDGGHARYVVESEPIVETAETDPVTPDPVHETPPVVEAEPIGEKPKGNASIEAWAAYATANGKSVDGLNRDEIRSLFKE